MTVSNTGCNWFAHCPGIYIIYVPNVKWIVISMGKLRYVEYYEKNRKKDNARPGKTRRNDAVPRHSLSYAMELPYIGFAFLTRIPCRGVPGFVTGCLCGVWCRRLTTCPQYAGPMFLEILLLSSINTLILYNHVSLTCFCRLT